MFLSVWPEASSSLLGDNVPFASLPVTTGLGKVPNTLLSARFSPEVELQLPTGSPETLFYTQADGIIWCNISFYQVPQCSSPSCNISAVTQILAQKHNLVQYILLSDSTAFHPFQHSSLAVFLG